MRGSIVLLALLLSAAVAAQDPRSETPPQPVPNSEPDTETDTGAAPVATVPVASEEPAAPPADDGDAVRLDEVTVTAERKVASLQETPISIEVFNADQLALRNIDGVAGLAAQVPAMTIEPFPTHNATLRMFIRGVGTADAQVTQDPAVAVYLDGVYIARSVGLSIDTAELERVEVLRGPQGTLYGRNTTGGAINLITRKPDPGQFTMSHQLTGGERQRYLGKSSFNVPLGDTLAAKFAVLASGGQGFVENTGPGGDFLDREQVALRFDARWLAPGDLILDYTFDWTDMEYYNGKFQPVIPPNTSHGTADLFKSYAQSQSVYSDRRLESLASGMPYELSRSKVQGHALIAEMPLWDFGVKYIGAYRELIDDQYSDLGGGAGSTGYRLDTHVYDGPAADEVYGGPTPLVVPQVFQEQMSHELQLTGAFFDDTLEFVAGGFWFEEEGGENGAPVHHILTALLDPGVAASDPNLGPLVIGLTSPRLVAFWDYTYGIQNDAQAAYLQLTWSPELLGLERRLHLTGGIRHSKDRRRALKDYTQYFVIEHQVAGGGTQAFVPPAGTIPGPDNFDNERGDVTYTDTSPSFNVRYDVTDDVSTYFTAARAYKSGGFNVRDPQRNGQSGPASDDVNYGFGFAEGFRPEYVQSYELGVKSEWFARRLRVNADVFDSHFTDMQTNFLIEGSISDTKARNAGKASMSGFELDSTLAVLNGLVLTLDYAYLDAVVEELLDFEGNNVAHLYPFVSAPRHSGNVGIDWAFADLGWATLRAFAGYNYIGFRQGTVVTEERRGLPSLEPYGLYNARLMASGLPTGHRATLEVALWGRNLADKEYEIFAIDNTPHADRAVLWGEPRTVGVDLTYRWF